MTAETRLGGPGAAGPGGWQVIYTGLAPRTPEQNRGRRGQENFADAIGLSWLPEAAHDQFRGGWLELWARNGDATDITSSARHHSRTADIAELEGMGGGEDLHAGGPGPMHEIVRLGPVAVRQDEETVGKPPQVTWCAGPASGARAGHVRRGRPRASRTTEGTGPGVDLCEYQGEPLLPLTEFDQQGRSHHPRGRPGAAAGRVHIAGAVRACWGDQGGRSKAGGAGQGGAGEVRTRSPARPRAKAEAGSWAWNTRATRALGLWPRTSISRRSTTCRS